MNNKRFSAFNDAIQPSQPATAAFEDSFNQKTVGFADDDSWNANSWNNQASDPFSGANKPDPFAATNDASAKDVSESYH